ncbi:hypothetical protein QQP08_003028, partial [Theobroma cacao]
LSVPSANFMQIGCVSGCRLISPEVLRSVLAECANLSCLGAKTACKVGALRCYSSEVVEAYSRPTRIVHGKDVDADMEVDDAAFETNKERALWDAFFFTKSKIHPGIHSVYYQSAGAVKLLSFVGKMAL